MKVGKYIWPGLSLTPTLVFLYTVYLNNVRGSHLDIAAMFLAGIASTLLLVIWILVLAVKGSSRVRWLATIVNAIPLIAYLYLVAISSSI